MDWLSLGINKSNIGSSTGQNWLGNENGKMVAVYSPVDGKCITQVLPSSEANYEQVVKKAQKAFQFWRNQPAPQRGEIIRQICLKVRENKEALGSLISYEMGKPLLEGLGEVQEMIDMGDFAVGQARMLYGKTMPSERAEHRLFEQYHPLGVIGVITAFNFPLAVWAWNALLAAVCGNVTIWKPSSKTPLTAIAIQKILAPVLENNNLPEGIFSLVIGSGRKLGDRMANDNRLSLLSFTGSVATGRKVSTAVASRLGRSILELGGNNAIILTKNTDLKLAIPAVVFGAVGTAGQRCTTTRRLIVHQDMYEQVKESLVAAYGSLRIGSPLESFNHMGPLVDKQVVEDFFGALESAQEQGAKVICGGTLLVGKGFESGCYVSPAIILANSEMAIVQKETFAPILYLLPYQGEVANAISIQNNVRQGLSSAVFTKNQAEAEIFLSQNGSDCGIANINIGTSGAEIGGAFGGEKETGGGREAGSDSWKAYMRRQTVTINYGAEPPLAQGISFTLAEGRDG